MKNLLVAVIACLTCLTTSAQNSDNEFDGHKWIAPYTLTIPMGWGIERFLIPIGFAPQIPYKGVEDLRFAPGWADVKSDDYWSYAFLWYLDGKPKTDAKTIENNLEAYYNGLIAINTEKDSIPSEKLIPTKTSIKKVKTDKGDIKTYTGTIEMLDYMQQKPITLNCIVHLKSCSGQDKTYLFYELSPKPFTAGIWQSLNQLWKEFDCEASNETK